MNALRLALPFLLVATAAAAQNLSGPTVGAAPSLPGPMAPAAGSAMPMSAAPGATGMMAPGATSAAPALPTITGGSTAGVVGLTGVITTSAGLIYENAAVGDASQGFMTIENDGSTPDILQAVNCTIADKTTLIGADGKPVAKLQVAPGKQATMAPKGLHITLQNTHFQILPGSVIPCALTFQNAGQIQVLLSAHKAPTT